MHTSHLILGPRLSLPRVGVDLLLWFTLAWFAPAHPAAILAAVFFIGFVFQHDLLVHGHEATHGNASRIRPLNSLMLWGCHGLFGLSGRAYRAFHMDHHRAAHTPHDSEAVLYGRGRGIDFLLSPIRSLWVVNTWRGRTRIPAHAVRNDLVAALVLHLLLLVLFRGGYLLWVLLPMLTGLPVAVVLRAITEHHGAPAGDAWKHTRATAAHPVLRLLWSNVDHHLEHHLAPQVPWHRLPGLRRELEGERRVRGIALDRGLIPTALGLLFEPEHRTQDGLLAVRQTVAHRLNVRWMRDILKNPRARRHLYSLYFHGEAYEDLHPLGVWIHKLSPRWGRKLRRQFDDENRHAEIFRSLLAGEGALPTPVEGAQDVGWFKLHHVVPEVCAAAGRAGPFTDDEAARYCGFLYLLERRSIGDLQALSEAAVLEGLPDLHHAVQEILQDEHMHASWTFKAMCELAGDSERAKALFDELVPRERKATHRVIRSLLPVFQRLVVLSVSDRLRWNMMAFAARTGAAAPPLPPLPQPVRFHNAA